MQIVVVTVVKLLLRQSPPALERLTIVDTSRVRSSEFAVIGISGFAREVGDCEYVLPIRCARV